MRQEKNQYRQNYVKIVSMNPKAVCEKGVFISLGCCWYMTMHLLYFSIVIVKYTVYAQGHLSTSTSHGFTLFFKSVYL